MKKSPGSSLLWLGIWCVIAFYGKDLPPYLGAEALALDNKSPGITPVIGNPLVSITSNDPKHRFLSLIKGRTISSFYQYCLAEGESRIIRSSVDSAQNTIWVFMHKDPNLRLTIRCKPFKLRKCIWAFFRIGGNQRNWCKVNHWKNRRFVTRDRYLFVHLDTNGPPIIPVDCTITAKGVYVPPAKEACQCGKLNLVHSGKFMGHNVSGQEIPSMASLHVGNTEVPFGTGVIICSNWILTYASAVYGKVAGNIKVYVGRPNYAETDTELSKHYWARRIFTTKGYNPDTFDADIALIKLIGSIQMPANNLLGPACLPNPIKNYEGLSAVGVAWVIMMQGTASQTNLVRTSASMYVMDSKQCKPYLKSRYHASTMCSKPRGNHSSLCLGGGGGVLIDSRTGIALGLMSQTACGTGPAIVMTKVQYFVPWIRKITGNCTVC